jgi:hypothetical protein
VARASPRQQEPPPPELNDLTHFEFGVQEHRRDLEPHPDRVDRPSPLEQHRLVLAERHATKQATPSFPTVLGYPGPQDDVGEAAQHDVAHPGRN